MLPIRHAQLILQAESPFVGRIDPVRRVEFRVGDVVIECARKNEIVSLSSWVELEGCPFCNAPTGNVLGPSGEPAVKPKKKPSAPQYVEGHRDYRIQVLVALLLITCLTGLGGAIVYFALNSFDPGTSWKSPTPEPVAETLTMFQPTVAATASLPPTAITPSDPLSTITEYVRLLNDRQYEQAFAILSDDFKRRNHCCETDGNYSIQPYIVYWQTVERLILVDLFLESQGDSQAVANTTWRFERANTAVAVLRFRITLHHEDRWKIESVVFAEN